MKNYEELQQLINAARKPATTLMLEGVIDAISKAESRDSESLDYVLTECLNVVDDWKTPLLEEYSEPEMVEFIRKIHGELCLGNCSILPAHFNNHTSTTVYGSVAL